MRPNGVRTIVCLALGLGVSGVGGCASYSPPSFRITDVQLVERSTDAALIIFTIEGDNPNREQLPLDTVRYSMTLDGRAPFSAQRSAEATLPGFGTQVFTIPVSITDASGGLPSEKIGYTISGTVEYRLPGSIADLLFDNDIRKPTQAFGESGSLDFTDASRVVGSSKVDAEK